MSEKDVVSEYEFLAEKYQNLTPLDIYYFALKNHGVVDEQTDSGRPTWNLMDSENLYHITFGTTEHDSPFSIVGNEILINENGNSTTTKKLPFRVDFVERIPVTVGRYHYFRHPDYMTPTLDNRKILNINFKRQCNVCDFCQYKLYLSQPDVSVDEGFDSIMQREEISYLSHIDQISVVTGLFGSEKTIGDHIRQVAVRASKEGFKGRIFYIGFEIGPETAACLTRNIKGEGLEGLSIAYTIETFEDRRRLMHGSKPHRTIQEVKRILELLGESDILNLEYTYMPGLDSLDDFKRGAELLASVARPHISILRPWRRGQRQEQSHLDYRNLGASYLCEMRTFYENLYGEKIYGDNLGNLWPFPLKRIDEIWVNGKVDGHPVGRRYWKGKKDLREISICGQK